MVYFSSCSLFFEAKLPPLLQPGVHRLAQPPWRRAGHPYRQAQIALGGRFLQHPGHLQHLGAAGPQAQKRSAQSGKGQNQGR
jgi:hypothetical protein